MPVVGGETDVGHRAFAAGEIPHQRLELFPLGGGHTERAGRIVRRRRDRRYRPDHRVDGAGIEIGGRDTGQRRRVGVFHMREVLRRHGRLGEVFELEGVTHHAAHGYGAVVLHRVVGGGQGFVLDGGGGDMAAHGVADNVEAVRVGEAGDVGERQRQFVGVFDAGAHVVEVGGVAGGGPGVAVIQQPLANAGVADGEFGTLAPVAVGVHHQAAVPGGRNLNAVAGAVGADAGPLFGVIVAGDAAFRVEGGGLGFAGGESAGVLDARRL